MNDFDVFVLFILTSGNLLITKVYSEDPVWMVSSPELDIHFIESVVDNDEAIDLCDQSPDIKSAICDYILSDRSFTTKYGELIDSSLLATYNLSFECEKKPLTFLHATQFNERKLQKDMFPCYARHNPMRTYWNVDDAFKYVYVNGVATAETVTVFKRYKQIESDEYVLTDMIENINIMELPIPDIWPQELQDELNTLQYASRNSAQEEIEINFILESDPSRPRIDPVCDLDTEGKKRLCELLITHPSSPIRNTILDLNAFDDDSTKCVDKFIHFKYATEFNFAGIRQKMYPCYGTHESANLRRWYLSGGYRDNSVIVSNPYEHDTKEEMVQFFEFYENLKSVMDFLKMQSLEKSSAAREREGIASGATSVASETTGTPGEAPNATLEATTLEATTSGTSPRMAEIDSATREMRAMSVETDATRQPTTVGRNRRNRNTCFGFNLSFPWCGNSRRR